jgi:hypothetical protein
MAKVPEQRDHAANVSAHVDAMRVGVLDQATDDGPHGHWFDLHRNSPGRTCRMTGDNVLLIALKR